MRIALSYMSKSTYLIDFVKRVGDWRESWRDNFFARIAWWSGSNTGIKK